MTDTVKPLPLQGKDYYQRVLHPLLALSVAVTIPLLLFTSALDAAEHSIPWGMLIAAVLFCAIVAVVSEYLFRVEHAGDWARVRELGILLVVLYVAVSLSRSGQIVDRFRIAGDHLLILIPGFLSWWLSTEIAERLQARIRVLELKQGLHGDDLYELIRDNHEYIGNTTVDLRGLLTLITLLMAFCSLYVVAIVLYAGRIGWPIIVFYPPLAIVYFFVRSYLFIFWQELSLSAEGLQLPYRNLRRQGRMGMLLLLAAGVLALAVARNTALLPISLLAAPLVWTFNQLDSQNNLELPELPVFSLPQSSGEQYLEDVAAEPGWFLGGLWPLLRQWMFYVVALAVLAVLFSPFLSKSFRRMMKKYGLVRSFMSGVSYVLQLLAYSISRLLRLQRKPPDYSVVERDQDVSDSGSTGAAEVADISKKKKRELDILSRGYVRLIEWAQTHRVRFEPSEPPQHFGLRIVTKLPSLAGDVHRYIEIFEEGMFSARELDGAALREFQLLQRKIRRTRD